MKPIQALFQSRKFILALFVTILGSVFVLKGQLQLADLGKWVAGVTLLLIAAISHEDAAEKLGPQAPQAPAAPPAPTVVEVPVSIPVIASVPPTAPEEVK